MKLCYAKDVHTSNRNLGLEYVLGNRNSRNNRGSLSKQAAKLSGLLKYYFQIREIKDKTFITQNGSQRAPDIKLDLKFYKINLITKERCIQASIKTFINHYLFL